jgi:nitroimidazol reductase NimA-like FMN-containing flavoprotein (pyridoxamine 5'-phosphate oxidase superfamily)
MEQDGAPLRDAEAVHAMTSHPELEARARDLIDTNRYLTLGTADRDGRPWVSPVYYTPVGYATFYWVSSPEARHSRNLALRPDVSMVVFDSRAPIGAAEAVYMAARAEEVPEGELAEQSSRAFRPRFPGIRGFGPDELRQPAPLRLYRATVTEHSVLIRGSDPTHGRGVDSRLAVTLSAAAD